MSDERRYATRGWAAAGRRAPGWWYPWIFVGAMGIVVAVNGTLVWFAVATWSGLETESHYERGLAYNRAIEAARRQDALGWRVDISLTPEPAAGAHGGALRVVIRDRDGRGLAGLAVEALARRPTQTGRDVRVSLADRGDGVYGGPLSLPLAGVWDIRLQAARGEAIHQSARRFTVP